MFSGFEALKHENPLLDKTAKIETAPLQSLKKTCVQTRKVRIKSQLRCAFLPLNQNWGSTTFSTRDMTLIQSALNSSYPGACFKYPEHYHNMRKKFSTWL